MTSTSLAAVSVGKLETVYTPPAACVTPILEQIFSNPGIGSTKYSYYPAYGYSYTYQSFSTRGYSGFLLTEAPIGSCTPPAASIFTPYLPNLEVTIQPYYSPGLNCPVGYTSACGVTKHLVDPVPTTGQGWEWGPYGRAIWSQLPDGNTAVNCCPSSWECDEAVTTEDFIHYALTDDNFAKCTLPTAADAVISGFITTEDTPAGITNYNGISSPTVSVVSTGVPVADVRPQAVGGIVIVRSDNDPTFGTIIEPPRLSMTDKIIIGIVVPVVIIVIAALILKFFAVQRRRRRTKIVDHGANDTNANLYGHQVHSGQPTPHMVQRKPLSADHGSYPNQAFRNSNFPDNTGYSEASHGFAGTAPIVPASQTINHDHIHGFGTYQKLDEAVDQSYGRPTAGRP